MSNTWRNTLNIADLSPGSERSILGYAGESLVIGRALLCGYNLFFKAWRDSKYDAVLDHEGILYRIEIKQSRDGEKISLTSGGRSGKQIDRKAVSREQVISSTDCDFLIAVHSLSGKCWVIPAEIIAIMARRSLPTTSLAVYEEAWGMFAILPKVLDLENGVVRLRDIELNRLITIAKSLGVDGEVPYSLRVGKRTIIHLSSDVDRYVVSIWEQIANQSRTKIGK